MRKQSKEKKSDKKKQAEQSQDAWSAMQERLPKISADALKRFCCAVILIETATIAIIENGLLHVNQYTSEELSEMMEENLSMSRLANTASILELVCGLAVPILAFLVVEGFLHTSDFQKYFSRVLIFAFLSEAPYDLAVSGVLIDGESQNPLWTVAVALLMLSFLRAVRGGEDPGREYNDKKDKNSSSGAMVVFLEIIIVIVALILVTLLECSLGIVGILLTAVYYLFYPRMLTKLILGMIVSLMTVSGPLGAYGIMCYSGERKNSWNKYVYYIFYPVHLLIFAGIEMLL